MFLTAIEAPFSCPSSLESEASINLQLPHSQMKLIHTHTMERLNLMKNRWIPTETQGAVELGRKAKETRDQKWQSC